MFIFLNLFVVLANIALLFLLISRKNRNNYTNFFIFLVLAITIWIITTTLEQALTFSSYSIWLVRLDFAFGGVIALFFYLFSLNFPYRSKEIGNLLNASSIILFSSLSLLGLSGLVVKDIVPIDGGLDVSSGSFYLVYAVVLIFSVFYTIILLLRKRKKSRGIEERQLRFVIIGVVLMSVFVILFDLILPRIIDPSVSDYGVIGFLFFIGFTTYAIVRHHLFDVKVIATEALVSVLWVIFLSKLFFSTSPTEKFVDVMVFLSILPVGYLLIRSVIKEARLAQQQYEMVATVSHQLRTPLTPVIGLSSMIVEGDFDSDPQELKDTEKKVMMAAERLRNVINDFLEIFELEGGKKFESQTADIVALIDEAIAGVKDSYEKKGLSLTFNNPENLKPQMKGEPKLLVQVFSNLLDNAEKYTPQGGTTVTLSQEGSHAVVTISDTGIGLTDEDKQHVFKKFYRSETAKQIRPDGSGLGLSIVRKILEAHGAKIEVTSPGPNKGTIFTITLPKR